MYHYKIYVLIAFFGVGIFLYLFTLTANVLSLMVLYMFMTIIHVAHEPTKNILIAEWVSRSQWEKTFASYEGLTEIGTIIGLLIGLGVSTFNFGATNTLLLCSGLNFAAFIVSLFLVVDPHLVFERGLVNIEKTVNYACKGIVIASKMWDGQPVNGGLKRENLTAFCTGLVLFSLATSILFTPLPIFFSKDLAMTQSFIFAVFLLNSVGEATGYFLLRRNSSQGNEKSHLTRTMFIRTILAFILAASVFASAYTVTLSVAILTLMGLTYGLILIFTLSLSMELIPAGKAGLFNVLAGLGGAFGAFLGPFFAQEFGFIIAFLITGITFLVAYACFKAT